jgi:hypothetical protein
MFTSENHIAEQELRKDDAVSIATRSLNKAKVMYWSHLAEDNPKGKWTALLKRNQ